MAPSGPFMVSSPVWVGAAGIHVVRSPMGSNSSSVSSRNLEPRSLPQASPCGRAEHPSVPDDDHVGGGAGDRDVHPIGVVHETPVMPLVRPSGQ
eukprot:4651540-Pyramimonas_sp.AAC.1